LDTRQDWIFVVPCVPAGDSVKLNEMKTGFPNRFDPPTQSPPILSDTAAATGLAQNARKQIASKLEIDLVFILIHLSSRSASCSKSWWKLSWKRIDP